MDNDTRQFLDAVNKQEVPAAGSISVAESRAFLKSLFLEHAPVRQEVGRVARHQLQGAAGPFPVDLFWPPVQGQQQSLPLVLFLHGGGWMQGDLECYENLVRQLCADAGVIMMSVGYNLAPEFPFPFGLEDCYSALLWAVENREILGTSADRIAVMGDSAGGNLAAALTLLCRDRQGPDIAAQFLIYPVLDVRDESHYPSRERFGQGEYVLSNDQINWTRDLYLPYSALADECLVSPICHPLLADLPPAFIMTAGCDPLCDEGYAYHQKLQQAGVYSEYVCVDGAIHAFLSLAGCLESGRQGLGLLAGKVREYLSASQQG